MKRWWSWILYVLAVYATCYLVMCNVMIARSATEPFGLLGTAFVVQIATGIPTAFLPFSPFVTSAIACTALVCLYRLSGRTFTASTKLYGWINPIIAAVLLTAVMVTMEKSSDKPDFPGIGNATNANSSRGAKSKMANLEYVSRVRSRFLQGMDYGQVMEVLRYFDDVELLNSQSRNDVDAATGKSVLRVPVKVGRSGSFDLIVEQETQTVVRTEDPAR